MHYHPTLASLFWSENAPLPVAQLAFSLALAAILAVILAAVYARFGRALSNRRRFASNFVLLTVTTTLIISIVKSSLALSLGLVGALSIVRFRAAIKEPEELVYLFLAISLGLGLGAGQTLITLLAFVIILFIVALQHRLRPRSHPANLYLTISGSGAGRLTPTLIEKVLGDCGLTAGLQRYDATPETVEAAYRITAPNTARLEECQQRLRELETGVRVSYVAERDSGE